MPRRGRGAKPFGHFVQTSTTTFGVESSEESENADGAFLSADSDSDSEGAAAAVTAAGELKPASSMPRQKTSSKSSSSTRKERRSSTRRSSSGAASRPPRERHKFVPVSARRPVVAGGRRAHPGRRARIVRHRRGCCGATPTTINVRVKNTNTLRYLQDWHHMLLDLSYHWLALIVILAYNFCFVVFALLWSSVRDTCNFGDGTTFLDAYYFSIETLMTIGYSAPDEFFGECWSGIGVLMTESIAGLLMNSFTLTLLYQRLSRGQRRSNTVVFSEKACVVVRGGRLFFEARVCDLTPGASLIGATVRVFAVRDEVDHRRNTRLYCQHYPMSVNGHSASGQSTVHGHARHGAGGLPIANSSDFGAELMMCLPSMVAHVIDDSSPIHPEFKANSVPSPRPRRRRKQGKKEKSKKQRSAAKRTKGGVQSKQKKKQKLRVSQDSSTIEVDAKPGPQRNSGAEPLTSNRSLVDGAGNDDDQIDSHSSRSRSRSCSSSSDNDSDGGEESDEFTRDEQVFDLADRVRAAMVKTNTEIVVLLEAYETYTSAALQCQHSYRASDIAFHQVSDCSGVALQQ